MSKALLSDDTCSCLLWFSIIFFRFFKADSICGSTPSCSHCVLCALWACRDGLEKRKIILSSRNMRMKKVEHLDVKRSKKLFFSWIGLISSSISISPELPKTARKERLQPLRKRPRKTKLLA